MFNCTHPCRPPPVKSVFLNLSVTIPPLPEPGHPNSSHPKIKKKKTKLFDTIRIHLHYWPYRQLVSCWQLQIYKCHFKMHQGTSSDKKTMKQRTEIEKKLMRPWAWCLATKLEIRGTKHVNFEPRSPRPVMSKRRRFFVKMSVTELKAHSIRYVVGNGRSACWATTANLLYLALTWESNHIVSFLTAWIGFMPSSICNSINSSTWSGPWPNTPCFHSQTGTAGLSTQEKSSVSSVELLRQLGKVFGNDYQGFVGRFTLA